MWGWKRYVPKERRLIKKGHQYKIIGVFFLLEIKKKFIAFLQKN